MTYYIIRIGLHIICFVISYYGLQAVDFNRFLKQESVNRAQVLYLLLSMALGYLSAQFLLALTINLYL